MNNQEYNKEYLAEIGEHILAGCSGETDLACRKGIIAGRENLEFVKDNLDFPKLLASHKVYELKIDGSWTAWMTVSKSNNNAKEFWNRIVKATNRIRDGLLVLTVSNMKVFEYCQYLNWLAKQENELKAFCNEEIFDIDNGFLNIDMLEHQARLMKYGRSKKEVEKYVDDTLKEACERKLRPSNVKFTGYVLIVLDELKMEDVVEYAKVHNSSEFDAMMQFYRFII